MGLRKQKRVDCKQAMELIDRLTPDFVVRSLPCTQSCSWDQHTNFRGMKQDGVDRTMPEGRKHPDVAETGP